MELGTSDYLTLLSDEEDINVANILVSIHENMSSNVGVVLGTIQTADREIYNGYRTKKRSKGFLSFYTYFSRVGHLSGIVFSRNRIDFRDLWREFNSSSSYGLLDIYPHVYLFNRILLENDIATDSRAFVRFREKGVSYMEKLNNIAYFHPLAKYEQLKKNLMFISTYSSFNFIEFRLLTNRFIRIFKNSVDRYNELDKETKTYFDMDLIENIDSKKFLADSLDDLIESNQIMLIDRLLLRITSNATPLYRAVKKYIVK